jgi:hypothetical protein
MVSERGDVLLGFQSYSWARVTPNSGSIVEQSSPEATVKYFWQPATTPVYVGAAGVAVAAEEVTVEEGSRVKVVNVQVVLGGPTPTHTARQSVALRSA